MNPELRRAARLDGRSAGALPDEQRHGAAARRTVRPAHDCRGRDGPARRRIERVYRIALSRPPTDEEKQVGLEALARFAERWAKPTAAGDKPDQEAIAVKALTTYCHTVMNSAAFLYVD